MSSGDYSAPPSLSSTGLRSGEPQFSGSNLYETQAPSISSTAIRNSEYHQFPTEGQRAVADQSHDQPPSYSALPHTGNSINGLGGTGDRGLAQAHHDAPGLDAVVHENNSTTGFSTGYSGYEKPPSQSAMVRENLSNPGGSGAAPAYDPEANIGYSIVGRNFPRVNLMGPPYN